MSATDQRPLVKNAADEKQVKAAKEKEMRGRERELDDLKGILSSPAGRRFVWRYLELCGVFKSSYTNNGSQTFFLEGQRNIGLKLMEDIMAADPNSYLVMTKEAKGDL